MIQIAQTHTERLEMPWRTKSNNVDCGIFAMRHMETYCGNKLRGWNNVSLVNERVRHGTIYDKKIEIN